MSSNNTGNVQHSGNVKLLFFYFYKLLTTSKMSIVLSKKISLGLMYPCTVVITIFQWPRAHAWGSLSLSAQRLGLISPCHSIESVDCLSIISCPLWTVSWLAYMQPKHLSPNDILSDHLCHNCSNSACTTDNSKHILLFKHYLQFWSIFLGFLKRKAVLLLRNCSADFLMVSHGWRWQPRGADQPQYFQQQRKKACVVGNLR